MKKNSPDLFTLIDYGVKISFLKQILKIIMLENQPSLKINSMVPSELLPCFQFKELTIQGLYYVIKSRNIPHEKSNFGKYSIPSQGVRLLLESEGFKYPKKNISIQAVKGGVGKTSLSFSLAFRANQYGAKVLCIDFDQQANLTRSFDINSRHKNVLINVVRGEADIKDSILPVYEGLDLIPSNLNNSRLDIELSQSSSLNYRDFLRDKLAPIRDNYDLIIMDCPPAINKILTCVTCASDLIIVPVIPDPYSLDGMEYTIAELLKLKKEFKIEFDYRLIWNKFDAREAIGGVLIHEIAKDEEKVNKILPVVIRSDATLKNAVMNAKSVFQMPKKSSIREDLDEFTKILLGINDWSAKQKTEFESI